MSFFFVDSTNSFNSSNKNKYDGTENNFLIEKSDTFEEHFEKKPRI